MVFLFYIILIVFILFLAFVTSKIKIEILKFNYKTKNNFEIEINIIMKIFKSIPIFKYRLNNKKIKKLKKSKNIDKFNKKFKNSINYLETQIINNDIHINIKSLNNLIQTTKKININVKKLNFNLEIGLINMFATTYIIPIISMFIAFIVSKNSQKKSKIKYKIIPKYELNQLLLYVSLKADAVIEINVIDIMDMYKEFKINNQIYKKNDKVKVKKDYIKTV